MNCSGLARQGRPNLLNFIDLHASRKHFLRKYPAQIQRGLTAQSYHYIRDASDLPDFAEKPVVGEPVEMQCHLQGVIHTGSEVNGESGRLYTPPHCRGEQK